MGCSPYTTITRFPFGTIPEHLRILYDETAALDLAALQVAGVVTVADFFKLGRFVLGAAVLVTETIEDDAANDGFVITDLFDLASGGIAGVSLGSGDYSATADQIVGKLFLADTDLVISSNNTSFVAGKIKVGYWYFAVL